MPGTGKPPDPVSLVWYGYAARAMPRVYAARGGWYGTRIADPQPAHLIYFQQQYGIDVTGFDNAATISGRHNNYRTRWNRAFVRAMYYWNDERHEGPGGPLEIQVGRPKPAAPGLPAGWAVRMRIRRGGAPRALRAVQRKGEADRIWTGDREPGGRFSDITGRDW